MQVIEKPFICDKCGRAFARKDILANHLIKQKPCVAIAQKIVVPTVTVPVSEIEFMRKEISELRTMIERLCTVMETKPTNVTNNTITGAGTQVINTNNANNAITINITAAMRTITMAEQQMMDSDMPSSPTDLSPLISLNDNHPARKIVFENYYGNQKRTALADLTITLYFSVRSYKNFCMFVCEDEEWVKIRVDARWGEVRTIHGVSLKMMRTTEGIVKKMYSAIKLEAAEQLIVDQFLKDLDNPEYQVKTINDVLQMAKEQSLPVRDYADWGIVPKC